MSCDHMTCRVTPGHVLRSRPRVGIMIQKLARKWYKQKGWSSVEGARDAFHALSLRLRTMICHYLRASCATRPPKWCELITKLVNDLEETPTTSSSSTSSSASTSTSTLKRKRDDDDEGLAEAGTTPDHVESPVLKKPAAKKKIRRSVPKIPTPPSILEKDSDVSSSTMHWSFQTRVPARPSARPPIRPSARPPVRKLWNHIRNMKIFDFK